MNSIFVLVAKDFALLFRSKMAVIVTFLMPLALVYGISSIYGLNGKKAGPTGIQVALVNESGTASATEFIQILSSAKVFRMLTEVPGADGAMRPLKETDIRTLMQEGKCRFAVVLPAEFVSHEPFKLKPKLLLYSRDEVENQIVTSVLEATTVASVPAILIKSMERLSQGKTAPAETITIDRRLAYSLADTYGGDPEEIYKKLQSADLAYLAQILAPRAAPVDINTSRSKQAGPFVSIAVEQTLGTNVKTPQATNVVGGWAMQFLLFALSGSAAGLFAEKNIGIFQRLLSGPVHRSTLLWSKFLYGVCLGLVQLMVLFVAGHFIIGFELFPYLGSLALVCLLAAAACSSFGMLIASVSRTMEAATGLATVAVMLMCALGGVWFPVSLMPEIVQNLSKLTLVYWANHGFAQVLWSHASITQLLPTLGILVAIVVLAMGTALWQFSRGNIFR